MDTLKYTILFITIVPGGILMILYILYRTLLADKFIPPNATFWGFLCDFLDDRYDDYRIEQRNKIKNGTE